MKTAAETRAVYQKILIALGLLLCGAVFLPWLSTGEGSLSGFEFAQKFAANGNGVYLFVILLPALLLPVSALLNALGEKRAKGFSVTAFIVSTFAAVCFLLSVKLSADASGLFKEPVFISNVGAGFWCFFLLSAVGLVLALKVRRWSTGYIVLTVLSVVWLFPILWVVLTSFRGETGFYTPYFLPQHFTLANYGNLISDTSIFFFAEWYWNTMIVAVCACLLSTFLILCTAYVVSRLRFQGRKGLLNLLMVLGMFPGFMAVFAVYYIIKGLGLGESLTALVLIYSGGAAVGFLITKGFFDTIPRSIEEAAYLDGATRWTVFSRIILPLSKPVIIYTILYYFISAVSDFLTSSVILGNNYHKFTLAVGMNAMLGESTVDQWFTRFAAGSVLIAIPICLLFIFLQKYYVDGISGSVKG